MLVLTQPTPLVHRAGNVMAYDIPTEGQDWRLANDYYGRYNRVSTSHGPFVMFWDPFVNF